MSGPINIDRLQAAMNFFDKAMSATPDDMDLAERARTALERAPREVVRELYLASSTLAGLAMAQLSSPTEDCAHQDAWEVPFAEGNVEIVCLKCGAQWPKPSDLA